VREWLNRPLPFGMWLATVAVLGLLFGAEAFLYVRLQAARVDAIERLCLRDNARSQAEIDFLRFDAHTPRALVAKARGRFKVESNCRSFALRAANQPPPQPGAPKP
jgi:hypothetical protein